MIGYGLSGYVYSAEPQNVILPLIVEQELLGEVPAWVENLPAGASRVYVEANRTLELLDPIIMLPAIQGLKTLKQDLMGAKVFSPQALSSIGIEPQFDEQHLEYRLVIPARLQKVRRISLTRSVLMDAGSVTEPAEVSAQLNVQASQDYTYGQGLVDRGRQPVQAEVDTGFNLYKWVLEANAGLKEGSKDQFRRGDIRVVRDFPRTLMRYQLGDLNYPTSGFQKFVPMGGVAATTRFSLQPYRLVTPAGNHELILNRKSRVQVYVNDRFVQTLDLAAGRHDLREFPLGSGLNRVRLEIQDEVGRIETIELPFTFSEEVLSAGIHELNYSLGFTTRDAFYKRTYDSQVPRASLFHRYGINDHLTWGGNLHASNQHALLGTGVALSTGLGVWTLDGGYTNQMTSRDQGAIGKISYLYTDYLGFKNSQRSIGFDFQTSSPKYTAISPDPVKPTGQIVHEWSVHYSQQFWGLFNLGASYRATNIGNRTLSGTLGKNWGYGIDSSLTVSRVDQKNLQSETSGFLLVTWVFPEHHQSVTGTHATQGSLTRLDWNYAPDSSNGKLNVGAGAETSLTNKTVDAKLDWLGNRGKYGLVHSSTQNKSGVQSHRSGARVGWGLGYADGRFGVSRPITDSFVIVRGTETLSKYAIHLNPSDEGYSESRSDWIAPAMIPNLVSYHRTSVHVAAPDAPAGVQIPKENIILEPRYKSGTLVEEGLPECVLVQGTLLDDQGAPVALQSGDIRKFERNGNIVTVGTLFTNREGFFAVEDLTPGDYEVIMYEKKFGRFVFNVTPGKKAILEVGSLKRTKINEK